MSDAWLKASMGDLGRGIAAGQIDPVALCETFLEAAAAHPQAPRIYARMMPERARAEAAAAARRAELGQRRGLLDGVPVSWKDLFDTAGVGTEAGSALLAGRVPAKDARVVRAGTMAGLVGLGKTHMSELAFSGLGFNPSTETSPCVNDTEAVSGGSSSGAAASVAFGLAPGAIGSDTGGSVRVPAAWNDLVGLKTTHGRLSLAGVVPLARSFDTVGPLARTVEDAGLMLAALEGKKAPDLRNASLNGVHFLVLDTVAFDDIHAAPLAAFDGAIMRLEKAGAKITRAPVPSVATAMAFSGVLYTPEAYAEWRAVIEAAPEKMYPEILARFRSGGGFSGSDLAAAWMELESCRAEYAAATARYDAVLVPTVASLPPKLAVLDDSETYIAENLMALRNTRIGNLMGGCALSLPTGVPSCGISLMAGPMREAQVLRLGAAAESALA